MSRCEICRRPVADRDQCGVIVHIHIARGRDIAVHGVPPAAVKFEALCCGSCTAVGYATAAAFERSRQLYAGELPPPPEPVGALELLRRRARGGLERVLRWAERRRGLVE